MKGFTREDLLFSLCGLNCGLCPMKLDGYCPGCGGGVGNQSCAIARCAMGREGVDYCCQCGDFPCLRYEGIDEYDSFITHQNRLADLERIKDLGTEVYGAIQRVKVELLKKLLADYNDGRHKSFFCLAVNLLELEELTGVLRKLEAYDPTGERTAKERAAHARELLEALAAEENITLKLRKKPKQK